MRFDSFTSRHLAPAAAAGVLALGTASPALAHGGASPGGFAGGALHPLGGLDHLLAMVAVGLWAAQLGGRALLGVPLAFLAALAAGAGVAWAGVALPAVEPGILASLVVIGLLVACAVRMPAALGAGLVAVFALLHGHAHGAEMPAAGAPALYALGFLAATALLHLGGIAAGRLLPRGFYAVRAAGAAVAAAGGLLALGL